MAAHLPLLVGCMVAHDGLGQGHLRLGAHTLGLVQSSLPLFVEGGREPG